MQMKPDPAPLPVRVVDRATTFSPVQRGCAADVDAEPGDGVRVVQLTPPGATCSIGLGTGLDAYAGEPGSVRGLHLVVEDIEAARAELLGRGVDVGDVQDVGGGVRYAGFSDPDGNGCTLQVMPWRTGEAF